MRQDTLPATLVQSDTVAAAPLERLAGCADLLAGMPYGAVLPPLWHWLFFLPSASASELGRDGHRLSDGLLDHDPEVPARMWAGGHLTLLRQPSLGARITRESRVVETREREGRSGRLRFVTLRHLLRDETGSLLAEEQDLVFRAPRAAQTSSHASPPAPPVPAEAVTHSFVPDSVLLFRFSALTFNAHRIHYDRDYAKSVEHYPDLVVHGPLQAILLAALLHQAAPGLKLRRFAFRGQASALAGRTLTLAAWPQPEHAGRWTLQTRDPVGGICMTAQADLVVPEAAAQC